MLGGQRLRKLEARLKSQAPLAQLEVAFTSTHLPLTLRERNRSKLRARIKIDFSGSELSWQTEDSERVRTTRVNSSTTFGPDVPNWVLDGLEAQLKVAIADRNDYLDAVLEPFEGEMVLKALGGERMDKAEQFSQLVAQAANALFKGLKPNFYAEGCTHMTLTKEWDKVCGRAVNAVLNLDVGTPPTFKAHVNHGPHAECLFAVLPELREWANKLRSQLGRKGMNDNTRGT